MFERFTPEAKALVIEAQRTRAALGDELVQTEHLLLALAVDEGPAGEALRMLGPGHDQMLTALLADDAATRYGGPGDDQTQSGTETDDELLKRLGVDLDAVHRSADKTFGPGALDRVRRGRSRRSEGNDTDRQGRNRFGRSGRFNARSKRVLELSLREALRLKTKHIGPEHIGLGIVAEGEGTACRILLEEGVLLTDLRQALEAVALGVAAR